MGLRAESAGLRRACGSCHFTSLASTRVRLAAIVISWKPQSAAVGAFVSSEGTGMARKVVLVVPEAPAPAAAAIVDERPVGANGIRLGVLDNGKSNADHLLRLIVEGVRASVDVASVVSLRKASVSLPAAGELLDRLAGEADVVVSAMAD
jgi:hypothetical protein